MSKPSEPFLSRITIYPVKSLDGMTVQKAVVSEGGCLLHDREFAILDKENNFVNGKSNPLVHTLRSSIDFKTGMISFRKEGETALNHFSLQQEREAIETYLSGYFGEPVRFEQNKTGRFMDMPDIGGATLLSTSSLKSVAEWYHPMHVDEARKRFRATLEIDGVPAFWEDHLFSIAGKGIEFKVGDVLFIGVSPRERCVVPSRHPETGKVLHAFPKIFSTHRASAQPDWSALDTYGHHYYLTVNCCIPATETGKSITTGDRISITGERVFYE